VERSWRRSLPLIGWIVALLVGLAVFHGLGSGPIAAPPLTDPGSWGPWAAARDPLVATVAVLRLVVLALAWYLVGVTTIGLLARLLRAARLVRVADALTVPMVRRLLQSALGVGLATTMVGAATAPVPAAPPEQRQAVAAEALEDERSPATGHVTLVRAEPGDPPGVTMVRAGAPGVDAESDGAGEETGQPVSMRLLEQHADADEERAITMRTVEEDARGEATLRPGDPDAGASGAAEADDQTSDDEPSDEPSVHRVAPGESLWSIAQDALAHRWEREPTDAEVLPYWQHVIEHNRAALADPDNPDLLFPGDEIRLPAPTPEA
jgi:hypothetical protein